MRKKNVKFLMAFLPLLLLCACANRQNAEVEVSGQSVVGAASAATDAPSHEPVVEDTPQIPVYVFLHETADSSKDLIFNGWVSEEEADPQNGEPVTPTFSETASNETAAPAAAESAEPETAYAKYRDVSEVDNAIAIPSVYGRYGETVTSPLRICGRVDLCAIDLRIFYDTSKLKFTGFVDTDDDVVANCDEENGVLFVNFLRIVNIEDAFDLCGLSFEALAEERCLTELLVEAVEVVGMDDAGKIFYPEFSMVDAAVYLNYEE